MKTQRGFTLLEMVIVAFIIGIIGMTLTPVWNSYRGSTKASYSSQQTANDERIASALLAYAANSTALGTLPSPYTNAGTNYNNAIYNPTDLTPGGQALAAALVTAKVNPNEVNDDGYSTQRVRVYQEVTGLTQSIPLFFQHGPVVTLTYQYGAIYETACARASSACNPNPTSSLPGASSQLTAANLATWTTTAPDFPPTFLSSLQIQKGLLQKTGDRVNTIRDALLYYLREQQRQALATDTTNWYPSESASLGGATPASNQGCRDGWYDLSTSTVVLPTIGKATAEFGTTAWGAPIQYCRDFDSLGTKSPNAPPHWGALRINANVSLGLAPDAAIPGNNIVLTF